jgi:hypothetical protein
MMLTAFCPTTGDIYKVYNSNTCDNSCNATINQYPDSDRNCQICGALCYQCTGTADNCLACYTLTQFRVLSGNSCVCKSLGYYDDGVSPICPKCDITCKTCSGGTASDCTSCDSVFFRTFYINSCPCNDGYYHNSIATCAVCSYTCKTCSGSGTLKCLTCENAKFRYIQSDSSCQCMTGYYDNGTSSELCSNCHYSCYTCTTTAFKCLSCNPNSTQ